MSGIGERTNLPGIGHNRSISQRREEFEELITQHMLAARNAENMSLEQIRALSDKQRLGAYQNCHLVAVIRSCRDSSKRNTYHAVLHLIYAMADLGHRVCMLSASQMGAVLNRSERAIRDTLAALVEDGLIVKGEPVGRYGIVPHYPAMDERIALSPASPDWIINGFVPGLIGRSATPERSLTPQEKTPEHIFTPDQSTPEDNFTPERSTPEHIFTPSSSTHEDERTLPMKMCAATHEDNFTQNSSIEISIDKYGSVGRREGCGERGPQSPSAPPKNVDLDLGAVADDVEVLELEPIEGEVISPGKADEISKSDRKKTAVRFPGTKHFGKNDLAAAVKIGLTEEQARTQFKKFQDNALSKDLRYSCWHAAWRNWCRKFLEFKGRDTRPQSRSNADIINEIL